MPYYFDTNWALHFNIGNIVESDFAPWLLYLDPHNTFKGSREVFFYPWCLFFGQTGCSTIMWLDISPCWIYIHYVPWYISSASMYYASFISLYCPYLQLSAFFAGSGCCSKLVLASIKPLDGSLSVSTTQNFSCSSYFTCESFRMKSCPYTFYHNKEEGFRQKIPVIHWKTLTFFTFQIDPLWASSQGVKATNKEVFSFTCFSIMVCRVFMVCKVCMVFNYCSVMVFMAHMVCMVFTYFLITGCMVFMVCTMCMVCMACMVCTVFNHSGVQLTSQSWCARSTPRLAPSSSFKPTSSHQHEASLSNLKLANCKLGAKAPWPAGKPLPLLFLQPPDRSLERPLQISHTQKIRLQKPLSSLHRCVALRIRVTQCSTTPN